MTMRIDGNWLIQNLLEKWLLKQLTQWVTWSHCCWDQHYEGHGQN